MEEVKNTAENAVPEAAAAPETAEDEIIEEEPDKETRKKDYMAKMRMNDQYKVLPVSSYFWTMVLFCIPVLGQFCCIIMALGGSHYRNKVHFARAWLLGVVITAILSAIGYLISAHVFFNLMAEVDNFLTTSGIGYPTDWTKLDVWVKALEQVPAVHDFLAQLNDAVSITQ